MSECKYLDTLHSYMPTSFNTYIEPFVGSGAFFLHIQPTKWIINDTVENTEKKTFINKN